MEYPLEYTWNLYATRNKKKPGKERSVKDWENRLQTICKIHTAEEFWGVFNNLKAPSEVHGRGDYFLFKDEVMPEWEHPRNEHGGAWNVNIAEMMYVDEIWLKVLLHLIGFAFGELMEHVCGVEITIRNAKYRLLLWMDSTEESEALAVGQALKPLVGDKLLEFRKHNTSNILYTV